MNNLLGIDYGERYIGLAIKKDNAPIPYAHKVVDIKEHDIIKEIVNIVTQINGKKRKVFSINKSIEKEDLIENIKNDDQIKKYIDNKKIIKTIYIENKLINFIIE